MYKAWTSFPFKEIVWRSDEHVTISLASVASVILLLIITVSWKYARISCDANDEVKEIYQGSNFGYFGGEAPSSPRGTYQEPNVVGQLRPDAPNEGQCSSLGIGHNFELPFADATPVSSPIKRTQDEMSPRVNEYPVRRTFLGTNNDVWNEFYQYFENIAELNSWGPEKSRRVLLSTLRGQAESYAYGIPLTAQRDYEQLKMKMEQRFGHSDMKERYIADAKLRKRQSGESLRDFGQAIEDLYRRAYPENPDIVEENAIKSFLDKCGQSEDFRLAVKRTRPKTLQEAVLNAMQEECLRVGERELLKDHKAVHRQIYEIGTEMGESNFKVATGTTKPPSAGEGFPGTQENLRIPRTCRYEKLGRRGRPYNPKYRNPRELYKEGYNRHTIPREPASCVEKEKRQDLN